MTFLLTDVEGSTRSWERDSAATAAAISRHYEVLDEVIARCHGQRPVEQGEGDSIVAVFVRPRDAIEAALAAVRVVEELGLRIRVAVHSGDAELRDDGNYFGPTIIRCARLRSIGHGGQVLLSDATRQLLGDRLPAGASLQDLGQHRLKDLARGERVWQVTAAEQPGVFPPLRSLDAFGHNLPIRLTPLIGRESETASVAATVFTERLVTLTGPGGVGKTRLALQAAGELVDRFDGGVWWVDLAPVSDPGSMPAAVLASMGVAQPSGVSAASALVDQLAGRSALFVLDNCEHLIARCAAFVDELLISTPTVRVLATSREALNVPGEIVWIVPSMGVPSPGERATVASVSRFDAVRLFVDRAQRARHGLELTDELAPAVARICSRLDGIPLSIELAAARCRSLGIDQIARELDERFRLLTGGSRTGLARQQTLKASIEWSHELLTAAEQSVFRRLGVFVGPFTVEAAEAAVGSFGDIASDEVFDLLDRLTSKSLVALEASPAAGQVRYRMLETIRSDALERLDTAGELAAARGAHLDYWSAWAAGHNLLVECDLSVLDDIEANLGNLTAAVGWACTNEPRHLVPLMLAIGMSVPLEDDSAEGMGLFSSALAALDGDEVGWAQVAMAAVMARAFAWVIPPDEQLRRRIEAIATKYDLRLVRAFLAFVRSAANTVDPVGLEDASEQFAAAGSTKWSAFAAAVAARYYAAKGDVDHARRLLGRLESDAAAPWLARQLVVGAWAQLGIVTGDLVGVVRQARDDLDRLPPLDRSKFTSYGAVAYESVGRAAFFAGDRDVIEEIATHIASVATSGITRRVAAVAATCLDLFDGTEAPDHGRTRIAQTLRHRAITGSSTGGGLLQRETLYLAIAASDHEWIAAERSSLARFGSDGDPRIPCSLHLADAVLAMVDENASAEEHWHDLLAAASEHDYRILQIDALEGLALCALRTYSFEAAARLAGAAARARDEYAYQYRYPHVADLPSGSTEGPQLTLDRAVALAQRARGERRRPKMGWKALTPTEIEVAVVVADGRTNKQAGDHLFMSTATVKTHLSHIFDKLGIENRAQLAVAVTLRQG